MFGWSPEAFGRLGLDGGGRCRVSERCHAMPARCLGTFNTVQIPKKEHLAGGGGHRLPNYKPCCGSNSAMGFRVIYFSLCSYPYKGDIRFTSPKLGKFNSLSRRISFKFASTKYTAVVRNVI